ncbi:methyltransferase domain protein [Acrodontium crateriforme]|uniref:Methyltransferase domain protein n=1 Tax=Acrodontium crateriforme TaxID=150365 RepID=A0AAQ3M2Q3_9PEZI|nr:methyltransferase domain protein [Acrodontium crateriforme]
MASRDYEAINKANWDERAPQHAKSEDYGFKRFITEPDMLSNVVTFDIPLLGDITGLEAVHLQCHIGTDTLSLARRGAKSVIGLDFSSASLKEARNLAAQASGGDKLRFVEGSVYDAFKLLDPGSFDLVYTGIGALCWLPSIKQWAETVASLLKPGGQLFIREGHPVLWSIDEKADDLVIRYPYFERNAFTSFDDEGTYVKLQDEYKFVHTETVEWNHGIGEIVQALLDAGMRITGLKEHESVPWEPLPGKMVEVELGEYALAEGREILPLTYTLQAVKM